MLTLRKLHRTIALSPKEETSVRAEVLLHLLSLHDGSARRFPESTVCNADSANRIGIYSAYTRAHLIRKE
ncbi:hypothetical protein HBH47_114500 [Parastagonospora nodorum]|nr:hypothetical protein HBH47_114500 [Parastagonospora nodorum]